MPARAALFSVTDVRRAIKVARDLGLTVTGYDIRADGGISVRTAEANENGADAALESWKRTKHGKR